MSNGLEPGRYRACNRASSSACGLDDPSTKVVLARPPLDKDGHKKWKPPISDRPTLTLYARVGKGEGGAGPLADHHRRLEDDREVRRQHGAQIQRVRCRRRRLARDSGHADLAPGDGHTQPQAAHQAGKHLGAEDRDHRPGLPRGLRAGGARAPSDRGQLDFGTPGISRPLSATRGLAGAERARPCRGR